MSAAMAGWQPIYSGKVRDLYAPVERADSAPLLVVASDRVSAFDHILTPSIPGKGVLLTRLSRWWFAQLDDVPNHLWTAEAPPVPAEVADRSMLVKKLDMFPIECVVRGYLSGSAWSEYQQSGTICAIPLPSGLRDGDRLPSPVYTPAFKAELGDHDENITFERTVELVGSEVAHLLRDLSLHIYERAAGIASTHGVILADTKFEFGRSPDSGTITLADEVLTSDSSRYWDAKAYADGRTLSFDKQIVRDWLRANWDQSGEPPALPDDIVRQTSARYRELIELLTGH